MTRSPRGAFALVAALLLAAACDDAATTARPTPQMPPTALLQCRATVADLSVSCSPLAPGGANRDVRIVGSQGYHVRLTSSGVAYAAEVFSFNVTVQNLLTMAMGTADGATRHADGVKVFFHQAPVATGGSGDISVLNATGSDAFTGSNQSYFQYGGAIGGTDQGELGGDGILSTAEVSSAKAWQLSVPATVTSFGFQLYVTTETPAGTLNTAAPQVSAVSVDTMVPGATVTLTGSNFNLTPASNVVTIGGVAATVTGATATTLTVVVPCISTGNVPVQVATGGMKGVAYTKPLKVAQIDLDVGEAVIRTSAAESFCNELTSANGTARYFVSVFNSGTSPTTAANFQISGDPSAGGEALADAAAVPNQLVTPSRSRSLQEQLEEARVQQAEQRHERLLEQNAEQYQRLRTRFAGAGTVNRDPVVYADPPLTRTFRVSNINDATDICNSYYVVSATRVYFNGKIAIYEDDATPNAFKSAVSATMASNYQRIGDQFNADMEPIIRNNFGDILRRDAVTDNNGVLIALFTPRINTSFSGVAGFVISCDQYPNTDANSPAVGGPYPGSAPGANGASNFGEFFYAYQPVTDATGYSANTPENWYRTIRSTFIHESKHVASMAARVENNAPTLEASWLEEGTARHSEELWMRNAVDNVAWKGNTGYGSAANPINVYCDVRVPPGFPECSANPRRPASIMQRHFGSQYTHLFGANARLLSPFGRTPSDTQSYFYAISWSLVRYAIDRYGTSDAAFLGGLTQSTTSGVTNLTGRAGVNIDQLLGGWFLSLAADDYPGMASPSVDIQMPTWNYRSIYAGLNTDFSGTYSLAYPLTGTAVSFGSFSTISTTTIYGGGGLWYQFSGTQTAPQLVRLQANGGGALSSNMRMAVTRVQ